MIERPYQTDARLSVIREWESHQTTLVSMATGLGKTYLAAMLAKGRAHLGRTMFLAHREELVWQADGTFRDVFGKRPLIEMGEWSAYGSYFGGDCGAVISTVQTQYSGRNGGRMTRFNKDEFATLIIDEAHHYIAPSYRRVVDYYLGNPNLRCVGITATPDRADNLAMGRLFKSVAFEYGIKSGIADGWLVNVDQWTGTLSEMDLSDVGTVRGDLNAEQLANVMEKHANCFGIVDRTLERAGERRTLVFAASVNAAKLMASIFNNRRPNSARFVYADTPPDERRKLLADYASGQFQFLCNVGIATEGFNDPGIECVVMGRPTKSRALYTQCAGRGTRTLPGVVDQWEHADDRRIAIAESCKPSCLLIDFVGNAGRHKLVTAMDILGGDYDSEVVTRAKQKCIDAAEPLSVPEALEAARLELIAEAARERARREREEADRLAALRLKNECHFEQVDPFEDSLFKGIRNAAHVPADRRTRPSESQLAFLDKHAPKFDMDGKPVDLSKITMGQAGRLIGEIRRRWQTNTCSLNVGHQLRKFGLPFDAPKDQAARWMTRIRENNWQVPRDVRAQAFAMQMVASNP